MSTNLARQWTAFSSHVIVPSKDEGPIRYTAEHPVVEHEGHYLQVMHGTTTCK